jgi:hypothetical protein
MRHLHNLPTSLTIDHAASPTPSALLSLASLLHPHSADAEGGPTQPEGFFRNSLSGTKGDMPTLYVDQFSRQILSPIANRASSRWLLKPLGVPQGHAAGEGIIN